MPGPYFPDAAAEALRSPVFDSSAFLENEDGNVVEMLKYLIGNSGAGRVHVQAPEWRRSPGTDFWLMDMGTSEDDATGVTTAAGITQSFPTYGWILVSTNIASALTAAGDLLNVTTDPALRTFADLDTAADNLFSPAVFGSAAHAEFFRSIFGVYPTRLCAEFFAGFEVNNSNETETGWGFSTLAGMSQGIRIHSNGANFRLASGGNGDVGAAVDTAIHKWKLQIDSADTEWFMDGVSQGTVATVQDVWPMGFRAQVLTGNGNFNQLYVPLHIWYEE